MSEITEMLADACRPGRMLLYGYSRIIHWTIVLTLGCPVPETTGRFYVVWPQPTYLILWRCRAFQRSSHAGRPCYRRITYLGRSAIIIAGIRVHGVPHLYRYHRRLVRYLCRFHHRRLFLDLHHLYRLCLGHLDHHVHGRHLVLCQTFGSC